MTYSQLLAYLQAYLQTNDPVVIGNTPLFIQLAASRVASAFRGAILELPYFWVVSANGATWAGSPGTWQGQMAGTWNGTTVPRFDLPDDFIALRRIDTGGAALIWKSPQALADIQACNGPVVQAAMPGAPLWFSIAAGQIEIYPAPGPDVTIQMIYLGVNQAAPANVIAKLPAMLLHGASFEAQMYQGDNQAADAELTIFSKDMAAAQGWDIQGGLTLGGM